MLHWILANLLSIILSLALDVWRSRVAKLDVMLDSNCKLRLSCPLFRCSSARLSSPSFQYIECLDLSSFGSSMERSVRAVREVFVSVSK